MKFTSNRVLLLEMEADHGGWKNPYCPIRSKRKFLQIRSKDYLKKQYLRVKHLDISQVIFGLFTFNVCQDFSRS